MDYDALLQRSLQRRLLFLVVLVAGVGIGLYTLLLVFSFNKTIAALASSGWVIMSAVVSSYVFIKTALKPFEQLRQAILHVSSDTSHMPAPEPDQLKVGRELVSSLIMNVYSMASSQTSANTQTAQEQQTAVTPTLETSFNMLPLPLFSIASNDTLHDINDAGMSFLGLDIGARASVIGKNVNEVLNLSFPSDTTFEIWLQECRRNVLKASMSWERVRLVNADGNPLKQFDLAASYSKATGDIDAVLTLFDHTEKYAADDQEVSFVAMAVHELRTPLTIMRGYIEVFEDELGPNLNAELKDFMHKMNASAQQLTAFVSNILNVARVEENQLVLTLTKQVLSDILPSAVGDLELRAKVHKKHIELVLPADLPPVAVDRISLHEVINNLVDNAIKYSGSSERIIVSVQKAEQFIQINVQDFGVGIPDAVVPKLFDKFYRSHRSKVQIGGTGLGLYLCKAIVQAHGGNIWVKTKEGEGSIFSFTLEVYDEVKHGKESAAGDGIQRGAHGWIKNHSLYRN